MPLWRLIHRTPSDRASGLPRDFFDGSAIVSAQGEVWAWSSGRSLLDPAWAIALRDRPAGSVPIRILVDTRRLESSSHTQVLSGIEEVERSALHSFRSWGPGARAELAEARGRLSVLAAESGVEFLIRPTFDGVVSDLPSAMTFARGSEGQPMRVLVEPAALLTEAMLPLAGEHMRRAGELLAMIPDLAGVLVSDVARRTTAAGVSALCRSDLGEADGLIGRDPIHAWLRESSVALRNHPIIVAGDSREVSSILSVT